MLYPGYNLFGGSNAQRDVLTQTLTEAAMRDGQLGLAQNLVSVRSVHKPFSPLTRRFAQQVSTITGSDRD